MISWSARVLFLLIFLQAILMPDILLHFQVIWIVVNVQDFKTVLLSFQNTNLLTLIKQQLLEIFLSLNDFSAVINNRAHLYIWANNGLLLLKMIYFFQRDKDRTPEDGDKWLKPNTVRHRRASRLQAPLSHSHEVGHKYRLPLLYPSTGHKMLVLYVTKNQALVVLVDGVPILIRQGAEWSFMAVV